jgi:hypothetical protein
VPSTPAPKPSKPSRRRFLRGAVAAFGVAALSGAVGIVRSRGYSAPPAGLAVLSPAEYAVVRAAAARICAADAPSVVTPEETDVAGFVDGYVARMPRALRRDLRRFLGFLEQLAPVLVGAASRFSHLSARDQDRVLSALERSSSDLLRGGFAGLKALVFMGYYRDPRTWTVVGYDGPWVKVGAP